MNRELADQVNLIERSLGERMVETAMTPVRLWLHELGDGHPFTEAVIDIRTRYQELFNLWLSVDDEKVEEKLDTLTGEAYQLADAVYVALRLKRGLSPQMHGFNPASPESVLTYFTNCVQLREEDLEWLRQVIHNPEHVSEAVIAVSALAKNLRECFHTDSLMVLIDGMNAEEETVATLCAVQVMVLFIHYDVRIEFFPDILDAFADAVEAMEDEGRRMVETLLAFIESSTHSWLEDYAMGLAALSWLPKQLQDLIEASGLKNNYDVLYQWVPKEEQEYDRELVRSLPGTWLYDMLFEDRPGYIRALVQVGVQSGYRDYMWRFPDVAANYYRDELRNGSVKAEDYLNYAHCLLLQGDRMMAYENYKQARQLCGSLKKFHDLYRPDRGILMEHGVPVEFVYMIEDNLIEGSGNRNGSIRYSESNT